MIGKLNTYYQLAQRYALTESIELHSFPEISQNGSGESVGSILSVGQASQVGINGSDMAFAQRNLDVFYCVIPILSVEKGSNLTNTFLCQHMILQQKQKSAIFFDNITPK